MGLLYGNKFKWTNKKKKVFLDVEGSITAPGPTQTKQKSIIKLALKKKTQYQSDDLFCEMHVPDL